MTDKVTKEPEKVEKTTNGNTYTARNPKEFKESYVNTAPGYDELSKGKSVKLNPNNAIVKSWIESSVIVQSMENK